MPVKLASTGEVTTAYLSGELDHHSAAQIRQAIDEEVTLRGTRLLVLDFGALEFMDSSGIGLVMGRYQLMKSLGGEVQVASLPAYLAKVMKLAGLEQIVKIEGGNSHEGDQ